MNPKKMVKKKITGSKEFNNKNMRRFKTLSTFKENDPDMNDSDNIGAFEELEAKLSKTILKKKKTLDFKKRETFPKVKNSPINRKR